LSEPDATSESAALSRVLALYETIAVLMLVTIGVLIVYAIGLGPLVGPGVESSFGLAVGLMFLCAALLVHLVDRAYRVWPAGRRIFPTAPGPVTDRAIATFLKVAILVAAGGAVAYIVWTLVT
jgi:hypothetical protein